MAHRFVIPFAVVLWIAAAPAGAQESEPDSRPRPRVTVAATVMDVYRLRPTGVDVTWRVGRYEIQGVYVRRTEPQPYEPDETRTFEWMTAGVIWPVQRGNSWFRPHLLAGVEMFRDTESDGYFPHRRPGIHGGLGADIPLGSQFFARLQYMTSATAGPLLDSAQRAAAACAVAAAQGEQAAREHIETGLWVSGGVLNGALFIIVPGVPILSHLDNARPPSEALVGVLPEQLECFNSGYRRQAKWRRATAAWIGFAGGAAILLTWLATHDS